MPLIRSAKITRPQQGSFYVWLKVTESTEVSGKDTILRKVMLTEWAGHAHLTVGMYMKTFNELREGWHAYFEHETPPVHRGRSMRGYYLQSELRDMGYKLLGQISGKFDRTDFYAVKKVLLYAYRHHF